MTGRQASRCFVRAVLAVCAVTVMHGSQGSPGSQAPQGSQGSQNQGFRFRTGVELINVTATVTDASGHFVPGLRQEDFIVYEDEVAQDVTHFSADRVPVSLGILLDTSQSMQGEKFEAARSAIDRFLAALSADDDEFFLMQFSSTPMLLQGWTNDRHRITRALASTVPRGGTAMYDAIADSVPLAQQAKNRKKAFVIVSDGNDMTSDTPLTAVHQIIRQSEALVYAVGIDCSPSPSRRPQFDAQWLGQQRGQRPMPFPFPGSGRPQWPQYPPPNRNMSHCNDPVDVVALRGITDDSGGRTEIIRDPRDLNPATANIADELSRQYYLGYASLAKKDGRWHPIRVELKNKAYRVRARRGYVAS